jgi:hypothetical protein
LSESPVVGSSPPLHLPFDLQCWYLHPDRTNRFAGEIRLDPGGLAALPGETGEYLARLQLQGALRKAILRALARNPPPSIEQLILTASIRPGAACTAYGKFRSRGLTKTALRHRKGSEPILYSPLRIRGNDSLILEVPIDPARFTASSSFGYLHRRDVYLFVAGFVESVGEAKVSLLPCVVATALDARFPECGIQILPSNVEEHVDTIDSFSRVRTEPRPQQADLSVLRAIPEAAVKAAFGRILGEQSTPKDWGGEKSDLFSAHVVVGGVRKSAAFLFKGPSKATPMTVRHLGANGDQILRLCSEPAELLVIQHCNEVKPEVRELLRVVANQISRPRQYCVIDGYDTLRVLRAYSECGLAPSRASPVA